MDMIGKYIYGIINSNGEKSFGPWGITALEDVYTIPYKNISAIVSNSEIVDYTTRPKDQVARYLLRHQQVIEKIIDSYPVIPVRLGTYAFNIEEVKKILCKGYMRFKNIFRKIDNKIEIDVVAMWSNLNLVIKEIGEGEKIKGLKEKLMSKPEGISSEDQIKIGSLIKNILDMKREKLASEIGAVLKKVSIDSRAHGLMDDSMIFNTAFLIDKGKKAELERSLDKINGLYDEKINFRCVGPLPPYSFYTVEVKKISFKDIEWARGKLDLNNTATKEEIIRTYRHKAYLYHPDKNIGISDTEGQFNEIFRAYKILLEYCEGDACSFDEKEFGQDAVIVKVKG